MGFLYPGIGDFFQIWGYLSPGIENFFKSGDLYPGNRGFLSLGIRDFFKSISGKSPGFICRGMGIFGVFTSSGFFGDGNLSGMGIFFRGMVYPTKKPPLPLNP